MTYGYIRGDHYGAHWSPYTIRLHDKWRTLIPNIVAMKQAKWERAKTVERATKCGLSYREIGEFLGISKQAVSLYLHRAQHYRDRESPIETYFKERLDLRILAGLDKPAPHNIYFRIRRSD